MGGFKIYKDNYADFTVISNRFIDEYMEDANDAQLKIYLYLMRILHADLTTDISDIADRFNYTEKDVTRALQYWEKKKLISMEYDGHGALVGVHMLPLSATVVAHPTLKAVESVHEPAHEASVSKPAPTTQSSLSLVRDEMPDVKTSIPDYSKPTYTRDDLLRFKSSETASQLVFVAEQYLQKTLSVAELGTLFYISDTLKFSDDLIDYLLQYCIGRGKADHRYIEAVARDWAESGITTAKQARQHSVKYDRIVYDVMNALGKGSNTPSDSEVAFIHKWTKEYDYDMSVIAVACERTVLNTDRKRFNYADSILSRWHSLGVRHREDIETLDPPRKKSSMRNDSSDRNKFNQFTQNTYDYDALEAARVSN